ncbi:putative signal transducing protein [Spartinivicinus ruber]|uniref:putative signal transducing protein n=1 Tax=Spartinivicinus ruber TaxID=2683272 RepID=UPI001CA4033F|nr:DUF2007 domain-containing protein [Spartinivicinus ruber]
MMKLVYTNENRFLVENAKNILENNSIDVQLKNEFLGSSAGSLPPMETWLELWVVDDRDYDKALKLIEGSFDGTSESRWMCERCGEMNEGSFDICWNCQSDHNQ